LRSPVGAVAGIGVKVRSGIARWHRDKYTWLILGGTGTYFDNMVLRYYVEQERERQQALR